MNKVLAPARMFLVFTCLMNQLLYGHKVIFAPATYESTISIKCYFQHKILIVDTKKEKLCSFEHLAGLFLLSYQFLS